MSLLRTYEYTNGIVSSNSFEVIQNIDMDYVGDSDEGEPVPVVKLIDLINKLINY